MTRFDLDHVGIAARVDEIAMQQQRRADADGDKPTSGSCCSATEQTESGEATSAPSRLNFRVEPLQFHPCFVDRELPIDCSLLLVDTG